MRLIDADALVQELCGDCIGLMENGECRFGESCGDMWLVRNAPTIDPVKHGKWKYTEAHPHWMFCDQCYKRIVPNKEWIKEYNIPTNYCPNCGAKMEEVEE